METFSHFEVSGPHCITIVWEVKDECSSMSFDAIH